MALWWQILLYIIGGIGGLYLLLLIFIQVVSKRPANLGVTENKLAECPPHDNCVSTFETEPMHAIAPLPFTGTVEAEMQKWMKILSNYPRAKVIKTTTNYIYAEFRSMMWRFIDDVEIFVDETQKLTHIRSASRVGTNDYGMNRNRVEDLKSRYQQLE
jgi:uncharacterized protein (DUF1499 family)